MISVRPARPASDLPFFAPVGLSRQHGRAFAMQLGADAFTIERNGAPVLIAGRWVQPDHQEIWMMHSPARLPARLEPARPGDDILGARDKPRRPEAGAAVRVRELRPA
jgi:hypothetical protein